MSDYFNKFYYSNENVNQNYLHSFEKRIIEDLKKLVDNDDDTISSMLKKRGIVINTIMINKYEVDKYISFEEKYNEILSHSIIIGNLPDGTTEDDIKCLLKMFGEYKSINFNELSNGRVEIIFYNLKDSMFMRASSISIKNRSIIMSFGKPLLVVDKKNPPNNGTIVVFNLPKNVSNNEMFNMFKQFGEIRDIRLSPTNISQRFVEFYDLRHAFYAKKVMKNKNMKICGQFRRINVQFSFIIRNNMYNIKSLYHNVPSIQRRSDIKENANEFILTHQCQQQIQYGY